MKIEADMNTGYNDHGLSNIKEQRRLFARLSRLFIVGTVHHTLHMDQSRIDRRGDRKGRHEKICLCNAL